ncbi:hypothetical protein [Streptomyces yaizuensis]|uniref:Uncharacterized protein n=1 Tax=Streptomyces yaizuensis TaxID=2989713 RepID=A0ABQ5PA16_9ACTN|nr:hypothetical protein [Streptomyces sp. YSPA8]GLF99338.1 hypothetical protein SYYSPA8_33595 [Streptomyces sp. YSPA8]
MNSVTLPPTRTTAPGSAAGTGDPARDRALPDSAFCTCGCAVATWSMPDAPTVHRAAPALPGHTRG